jgi:hypothetical protein
MKEYVTLIFPGNKLEEAHGFFAVVGSTPSPSPKLSQHLPYFSLCCRYSSLRSLRGERGVDQKTTAKRREPLPEAGVLDDQYSANPAKRSSHSGPPGYIGWTRTGFQAPASVDCTATPLSGVS